MISMSGANPHQSGVQSQAGELASFLRVFWLTHRELSRENTVARPRQQDLFRGIPGGLAIAASRDRGVKSQVHGRHDLFAPGIMKLVSTLTFVRRRLNLCRSLHPGQECPTLIIPFRVGQTKLRSAKLGV